MSREDALSQPNVSLHQHNHIHTVKIDILRTNRYTAQDSKESTHETINESQNKMKPTIAPSTATKGASTPNRLSRSFSSVAASAACWSNTALHLLREDAALEALKSVLISAAPVHVGSAARALSFCTSL
jgi:hypothetical protein